MPGVLTAQRPGAPNVHMARPGLCSRGGIREDREDEIVADRVGFERRLVIGSEIRGIHGFALGRSVFTDAVPSHERTGAQALPARSRRRL